MVSVVLTTYNGEKYIREQLKSILNQTCCVNEIIVCDDNSSDNTVKIINELTKEYENQCSISIHVNKRNIGYVKNFYQAIKMSSGDYMFLSDQDDIWMCDKVDRMLNIMKETQADVLCSNFKLIDSNGDPLQKEMLIPNFVKYAKTGITQINLVPLLFGNVAQGCSYCFTKKVKDIYIRANFDSIIHDYQIMLIGAALGKAFFINEKLFMYRIHENNSVGFSSEKNLKHIDFKVRIKKPKVVAYLSLIKKDIRIPNYYLCFIILYLKLPVIRAVFRRFLKREN